MLGVINVRDKKTNNLSKVYGVRRSLRSKSSAWERIKDSVGLVANAQVRTISSAVRNDFDSIYPWSDIITVDYNNSTKQITAYYGDANFTFTGGSNIQVMTKIPEFYYKRYVSDGYEYILISKDNLDGFVKSDEFMIGRYTMSGSASGVYSRSGQAPFTNKTIAEFRSYAKNLGNGWSQLDWHYFLIQLLYLVEYADYNIQSKIGPGWTNSGNTAAKNSGGCNALGMKSGSETGTDKGSVVYRGIEDLWGNVWQFFDGININNYQAYINYNPSTYASDVFDGDYQKLGYVNSSTSGSYITALGYDPKHPLVGLPTDVNGSSSTYMTDYYWTASDKRIALVGGAWTDTSYCGLWYWFLNYASSNVIAAIGARLLKTS